MSALSTTLPLFSPLFAPLLSARSRRFAAGLFLLLAGAQALAQEDPPGRVGRLNHTEGAVSVAAPDTSAWSAAELNRPLTNGDRIWTDQGARSELHIGSTAVRMDSETSLGVMKLDDQTAQLSLTQGRLNLRVRQLWEGERLEVDTPHLAFVINQPGDYRIEVDTARDLTRVAIGAGSGTLYGEGGETVKLGAAQQLALGGRNLRQVAGQDVAQQDAFERWSDERDRREDQSITARYVSRETPGYQQLDTHGDWQTDANYGPVWYPRVTVADWAPYRYGQWRWIAPWGWTWVDDAPWGFAPFHYGRWAQVGPRWCWVPGPIVRRPVYAPALVVFSGGDGRGAGVHWNIGASAGRPNVGWFPLGPGEAWRPGYRASARYIDNVNRPAIIHHGSRRQDGYVHQNRPGAMTAVPAVEFDQRRPVRAHWHRERGPEPQRAQAIAAPQSAAPIGSDGRERGGAVDSGRADPGHRPWRGVAPADDDAGRRLRADQERVRHEQAQRERRHMEPSPRQATQPQGPREQALREQQQRQQQIQAQQQQQQHMDQAQRQQLQMQRDQAQRERALAQQREQQERATQQQQEQQLRVQRQQHEQEQHMRAQRQQQEQAQQVRAQRQQQEQEQQVRAQRQQQEQAERAQRQQQEQQQRAQRQQQEQAERMRGAPPARLQVNRGERNN